MFKICEWLKKKGFSTAFIDESGAINIALTDKGVAAYLQWGSEAWEYLAMEIGEAFPKIEVGFNVLTASVIFFKVE